jgi:pyruvate dehydrogenase E2 component (dihydrolipoamide acetyltransferase)
MHDIPLVMPKRSMTMAEGQLVAWQVKEGDTVEPGQVVCVVATDGDDLEVEASSAATVSRLVAEPGAVVPVGEVLALMAMGGAADGEARRQRAVRARRAERLRESTSVPQFTVWRELDLDQLARRRGDLSWTALLLRALAAALREDPVLGVRSERPRVVLSLAVDSAQGLLAPAFTDPDLHTPQGFAAEVRRVVARARAGRIDPPHMVPGPVGLSNLGPLGAERFTAPVTPPQVAVLTVGAIGERVVAVDGGIHVRTRCTVGLTVDHRVAEGADGARLLESLSRALSDTDRLVGPSPSRGAGNGRR